MSPNYILTHRRRPMSKQPERPAPAKPEERTKTPPEQAKVGDELNESPAVDTGDRVMQLEASVARLEKTLANREQVITLQTEELTKVWKHLREVAQSLLRFSVKNQNTNAARQQAERALRGEL